MEKTAENAAAWALLARVEDIYAEILGDLVGIYVHGSLAFGCFQWERSDLDFIVVVEEPPALTEKEALIAALLCLTKAAPPKGLEMSVVLRRDYRKRYPSHPLRAAFLPRPRGKMPGQFAGILPEHAGPGRGSCPHTLRLFGRSGSCCGARRRKRCLARCPGLPTWTASWRTLGTRRGGSRRIRSTIR